MTFDLSVEEILALDEPVPEEPTLGELAPEDWFACGNIYDEEPFIALDNFFVQFQNSSNMEFKEYHQEQAHEILMQVLGEVLPDTAYTKYLLLSVNVLNIMCVIQPIFEIFDWLINIYEQYIDDLPGYLHGALIIILRMHIQSDNTAKLNEYVNFLIEQGLLDTEEPLIISELIDIIACNLKFDIENSDQWNIVNGYIESIADNVEYLYRIIDFMCLNCRSICNDHIDMISLLVHCLELITEENVNTAVALIGDILIILNREEFAIGDIGEFKSTFDDSLFEITYDQCNDYYTDCQNIISSYIDIIIKNTGTQAEKQEVLEEYIGTFLNWEITSAHKLCLMLFIVEYCIRNIKNPIENADIVGTLPNIITEALGALYKYFISKEEESSDEELPVELYNEGVSYIYSILNKFMILNNGGEIHDEIIEVLITYISELIEQVNDDTIQPIINNLLNLSFIPMSYTILYTELIDFIINSGIELLENILMDHYVSKIINLEFNFIANIILRFGEEGEGEINTTYIGHLRNILDIICGYTLCEFKISVIINTLMEIFQNLYNIRIKTQIDTIEGLFVEYINTIDGEMTTYDEYNFKKGKIFGRYEQLKQLE